MSSGADTLPSPPLSVGAGCCSECREERALLTLRVAGLEEENAALKQAKSLQNGSINISLAVSNTNETKMPKFMKSSYLLCLEKSITGHPINVRPIWSNRPIMGDESELNSQMLLSEQVTAILTECWDTGQNGCWRVGLQSHKENEPSLTYQRVEGLAGSSVREILEVMRAAADRGRLPGDKLMTVECFGTCDAGPLFLCSLYDEIEKVGNQRSQILQTILDITPAWFSITDVTHHVLFVNDNRYFRELSGCTPSEVTDFGWAAHAEAGNGPEIADSVTGAGVVEMGWRRWDGSVAQIRTTSIPFKDEVTGEVFRVGCSVDRALEYQLELKNKELDVALHKAEEASRTKDLLIAKVSHELRTPLNGIMGMTRLLRDSEDLSPELQDYLNVIWESGSGLQTVINDLLDYSRMELGKFELEPSSIEIRGLCEAVMATFRAAVLANKSLKLSLDVSPDIPTTVLADGPRLRQILLNLVGNSLKFTEKGHVLLRVRKPDSASQRKQNQITLLFEVEDTGIGIPPRLQGKLFKPFSQVDDSIKRSYGGTGLGLAIAKQIVELMSGRIWVSSETGRGSTFSFTAIFPEELPAAKKSRTGGSPRYASFQLSAQSPLRKVKPRILLAEDNRINQIVAIKFLEKVGLSAEIAVNGREAVDTVIEGARKGEPFDIILMDVMMPTMSGIDAAEEIARRRDELPRRPHIIALTASASEGDIRKCLVYMQDFLSKPVLLERLVELLERVANSMLGH
ncbi:hypothetical protein M427DRAFT_50619 [Gonapodya prolifera JEL478]|uniref:histidine kinase n=1 Tax=Gonapodya prolifera (strain JEL478) TaxID=1344416 RepID=A0A139B0R1_GONPJ|nr:hypothetical protein M427DRAFT_50619 [Gonapodya prolifera JEL478]|eukprot:KXS22285.1 hypothetical protein M427DRAFT_50619 [Gonapodya prolifera JEL478]